MKRLWTGGLCVCALLSGWVATDLFGSQPHSLRNFDGHKVGRLETDMWRSYYGHSSVRLFGQLVELLRQQYHLPLWRSCVGAYHAAQAAVVFQRGHNRIEYQQALPNLVSYYALIREGSDVPFSVEKVSALELEWWIVHRERAQRPRHDLDDALAALQAELYGQPASDFTIHARYRAEAMLLRDERAQAGQVSEQDWARIGALLDESWESLHTAVAR